MRSSSWFTYTYQFYILGQEHQDTITVLSGYLKKKIWKNYPNLHSDISIATWIWSAILESKILLSCLSSLVHDIIRIAK